MAIIECTECGHKVSDKADVCPSCGYKVSDIKKDMSNFVYCKINGEDVNVTELKHRLLSVSESERQHYQNILGIALNKEKLVAMEKQLKASPKTVGVMKHAAEILNMTKEITNLISNDLAMFLSKFIANNMEPIEFNGKPKRVPTDRELYIPKCPTCSSPNIRKLRAGEKATTRHAILWGRGGAFNKTWKCNNCGHTW